MSHTLLAAFALVFDPYVIGVMVAAGAFGLFVGAMPGLTATLATALLVPITFFMEPIPALAAIVSTTAMAIFAGDLPGALLRIPGTPASAAYVDDTYKLTQAGKANLGLGTSLVCAVLGGLVGATILAFTAPLLAEVALSFSTFEYFWLATFGLTCAAFVSTGSPVKGLVSLLLGLFIATIGIDIMAGQPRFTFGSVELMGGVSFIPAMIGMFAVSEVLRWALGTTGGRDQMAKVSQASGAILRPGLASLRRYKLGAARGSVIGTLIGILPGAGADIAAWVTYAISKKASKEPEKFGTGHVEGLVDAGTANNASLGGAWVPALVFGIPGDSITAIVIGILYMKGMNPGPMVMLNQPELLYAVFLAFFVANLLLLPLGWLAIKSYGQMLKVPREVLMPVILLLCMVGAFAINNTVFGVTVMLVLGVVAFVMEENGFPVAPAILGLVLGSMVERNFMQSMIKADGNLMAFFERPIAAVLGVVTLVIWLAVVVSAVRGRRRVPPVLATTPNE
ncbi:MAG: tripartite tricarboxylate transporter permease [Geminicoccaceae bacterium]|jgi:TctA family transporter|nr:tripartite tricarboxylate transporter permease [Geminicoccaceae bacterium]HRY27164.1 tripartite tricarboxylate transporter permease [Geminicoccaceae bacterium]